MSNRLRLVFFGSGEFGVPTLRRLAAVHNVSLIVTQPDRPAGRHRHLTPTAIGSVAQSLGIEVFKPERPNEPDSIERIHLVEADVFVVIAYGHKLSTALLGSTFAINLHASLLPKYRGAAPINWAMINGETQSGVSVIALAQKMDAGNVFAQVATPIDPMETAGELHDRLAALGPEAILATLEQFRTNTLNPKPQDESAATLAPKLTKADGTVDFHQPALAVRNRIHGLTPWPGATVEIEGRRLKLIRAAVVPGRGDSPGMIRDDLAIACANDAIKLLDVQPPGGRVMTQDEFQRGHALLQPGSIVQSQGAVA